MEITLNIVGELDPVAIYAALVATTILIWDVVKWLRSGSRLQITVSPEMKYFGQPGAEFEDKTFVVVKVSNVGSSPTTLTHLSMRQFSSLFNLWRGKPKQSFIIMKPEATPVYVLPYVLEAGREWMGIIEHSEKTVQLAQEGRLYAEVSHSVKRKPVRAKIVID